MITLPLADEFFLVGHDQYRGRPRVNGLVLDTGLAGAVLGELVLDRRIVVGPDTTVQVWDPRPYGERVSDAALAEVLKQDQAHTVRAWVEYLRDQARAMVGSRLVVRGLVTARVGRHRRFPAVDPVLAAAPQTRLGYLLDRPGLADESSAVLAALTLATGLNTAVGGPSDRQIRNGLTQMHEGLDPQLRALTLGVAAAAAQASLA
jgi:hypothetical protein